MVTMWKESTSVLNHFNPKSLLAAHFVFITQSHWLK